MKECGCCKKEKSLDEFYSDRSKKDRRTTQCKTCVKRKRNQERQDPDIKERRRLNAIEYRKRPEVQEHQKNYRKLNAARKREIQINFYNRNKDEINEFRRLKSREPFFNKLEKVRSSVSRIKRATNTFNKFLGCTYFEAQEYLYLNNHSTGISDISVDHIIPLSWAETEEELELIAKIENLHLVDLFENKKKFDKIYPKYYTNEILDIYDYIIYRQLLKNYE